MIIKNEKPPIYEEAQKLFNLPDDQVTFFTYGDTLYNPSGVPIEVDILRHEETHAEQQEHHPTVAKIWWERYLHDDEFRIAQEAEAYGAQYKFLCGVHKDKNRQARMLWELAKALSGPMYGRSISHYAAQKVIREWAEFQHSARARDIEDSAE